MTPNGPLRSVKMSKRGRAPQRTLRERDLVGLEVKIRALIPFLGFIQVLIYMLIIKITPGRLEGFGLMEAQIKI